MNPFKKKKKKKEDEFIIKGNSLLITNEPFGIHTFTPIEPESTFTLDTSEPNPDFNDYGSDSPSIDSGGSFDGGGATSDF